MEYYIYYDFYHEYIGHKHLIIILPQTIEKYKCVSFDPNEKIIKYIGNWLGQNVSLSYNEYLEYKRNWNQLWWFDNVIFVDEFRNLDCEKDSKIQLYNKMNLYQEFSGKYNEVIEFYINTVMRCGYKHPNFMKNFNIFVNNSDNSIGNIVNISNISNKEYLYIFEYKKISKKKIAIILPINLSYNENNSIDFQSDFKINDIDITYCEYKKFKLNWKDLDTYDQIIFIENFRNLDNTKIYLLKIFSSQNFLLYTIKGNLEGIVKKYIELLQNNDDGITPRILPYEFNSFLSIEKEEEKEK
jgi:hypothetical protein